jgi:hypothetical protein
VTPEAPLAAARCARVRGRGVSGLRTLRGQTPCGENNVRAECVSIRIDCTGRLGSVSVGVHADSAEILSQPGFEIGARRGVERLPRRAQHLMHNRWRLADSSLQLGRRLS